MYVKAYRGFESHSLRQPSRTNNVVEWLRFEHTIEELHDVAVLPGVRQAQTVGFKADDIQSEISVG